MTVRVSPALDEDARYRLEVGARLAALRTERGMDRRQLADAIGISYAGLRLYELGKRDLPGITAKRIASVLGVTTKAILG